ncbi:hypothetical protein [uncultured Bacteroides sp.]|uniref:hypothetical protein n=1 Tax=uncultured Bacteroides sp. TaxID=162156 RepID=UPI0026092778|nr:hypothetical protein [uncultured Bacteroides sp.]
MEQLKEQRQQGTREEDARFLSEIQLKEDNIRLLETEILDLQIRLFHSTPVGQLVRREAKYKQDILKPAERATLVKTLDNVFSHTVQSIKEQAPDLTSEDCLYCCLSLSGFSTQTIAACFGYQDGQVVRQRKYRVRQKWPQSARSSYLYKRLFGEEKDT